MPVIWWPFHQYHSLWDYDGDNSTSVFYGKGHKEWLNCTKCMDKDMPAFNNAWQKWNGVQSISFAWEWLSFQKNCIVRETNHKPKPEKVHLLQNVMDHIWWTCYCVWDLSHLSLSKELEWTELFLSVNLCDKIKHMFCIETFRRTIFLTVRTR